MYYQNKTKGPLWKEFEQQAYHRSGLARRKQERRVYFVSFGRMYQAAKAICKHLGPEWFVTLEEQTHSAQKYRTDSFDISDGKITLHAYSSYQLPKDKFRFTGRYPEGATRYKSDPAAGVTVTTQNAKRASRDLRRRVIPKVRELVKERIQEVRLKTQIEEHRSSELSMMSMILGTEPQEIHGHHLFNLNGIKLKVDRYNQVDIDLPTTSISQAIEIAQMIRAMKMAEELKKKKQDA